MSERSFALLALCAFSFIACGEPRQPPASPDPPEEVTTLLIPVLLGEEPLEVGGRSWSTMTIMDWPGSDVLWIAVDDQPVAIRPGASRPPEFRRNALEGSLVLLPASAARELRVDHFLRDSVSGETVSIPTPRAYDAEPGGATLSWTPGEGTAASLRIYDLVATPDATVTVALTTDAEHREIGVFPLGRDESGGPHVAEIPLPTLGAGRPASLEVTPSIESARIWVMLVESDPKSGSMQILSSGVSDRPLPPGRANSGRDEDAGPP